MRKRDIEKYLRDCLDLGIVTFKVNAVKENNVIKLFMCPAKVDGNEMTFLAVKNELITFEDHDLKRRNDSKD